jgi:hypothetical protein
MNYSEKKFYDSWGEKSMLMKISMGEPVTDKIQNERSKSVHGMGLDLSRGPDPRSFNAAKIEINKKMRSVFGMDD